MVAKVWRRNMGVRRIALGGAVVAIGNAPTALFHLLNRLAEPFLVTTGRHLRTHGWPAGIDTLVVMLDGESSFSTLDPAGISIWWGAYVGMEGEILDHGPLSEAGPRITWARAEARARRGWPSESGRTPTNCARTGTKPDGGSRSGTRTSAKPVTSSGARPLSAPSTGSMWTDDVTVARLPFTRHVAHGASCPGG